MPRWKQQKVWNNRDVFIIGGGVSLKDFNWRFLEDEPTIGCNDAFKLGALICNVCLFGDAKSFWHHKKKLEEYEGEVFTNDPKLQTVDISWLQYIERRAEGLHLTALGFGKNTGLGAINLALLLGARRVFLLGFDMHLIDGESNWHKNELDVNTDEVYLNFLDHFKRIPGDLKKHFPLSDIINVTDDSSLDVFPKIGVDMFWNQRKGK